MAKKTFDDIRFEMLMYLTKAECPNPNEFIEDYNKLYRLTEPIKYKHIGLLVVPLDLYNACKRLVPPKVLDNFEKQLNHLIQSEPNIQKVLKIRNEVPIQFQNLYDEYSNVTTEEAKKHYN